MASLMMFPHPATCAPGDPDKTFGTEGRVITMIGLTATANSTTVQADGKILVAGSSYLETNNDFALVRYRADGTLDQGFGTGGIVTTAVGTGNDFGMSVVVQGDAKILVAGRSQNATNTDFSLVRYQADGSPDTSFGTGGKVTTPIGSGDDAATSMVLQTNGKILVAGHSSNGNNLDFALMRYHANGSLDSTFGNGGKVTTAIGSFNDVANSVAVQSDGKIVVAGSSIRNGDFDLALVRYSSGGSPDSGFGSGGKVSTAIGSNGDYGRSVAVLSDGRILVAGDSYKAGESYNMALVRYLANGSLDATFGTGGKTGADFGSSADYAYGMAVQADGKIVLAGFSDNATQSNMHDFAVARFHANGSLDPSFGSGGKTTTPVGSFNDQGLSCALQPDGKILLAGSARAADSTGFALVRFWDSLPLTPQQNWRLIWFATADNAGNAADLFDADGDGMVNLLEWATNRIPIEASVLPFTVGHHGASLEFTYPRSIAAFNAGAVFTVEWSDALEDIDSWNSAEVVQTVTSETSTEQLVKATMPAGPHARRFVRLRVAAAP